MTKKKSTQKKSSVKRTPVKKIKCWSEDPNFLVFLLAASIVAFSFLFRFL
ncbi:MAG TPA: hypothetical protein PK257_00175 [Candidatus Woesebacteria bacterium]|nr:hypothetical protein [Candidatus Woesebacteria bacterium]